MIQMMENQTAVIESLSENMLKMQQELDRLKEERPRKKDK